MDTNKYFVMACLYEGVVACLDKGVVILLDNNNKDNFNVDIRNSFDDCFKYFLLTHPLK